MSRAGKKARAFEKSPVFKLSELVRTSKGSGWLGGMVLGGPCAGPKCGRTESPRWYGGNDDCPDFYCTRRECMRRGGFLQPLKKGKRQRGGTSSAEEVPAFSQASEAIKITELVAVYGVRCAPPACDTSPAHACTQAPCCQRVS